MAPIKKVNPLPRGRTGPEYLNIPAEWKLHAGDQGRFVIFDSGRRHDRVIVLSAPYLIEVDTHII